MECAEGSRTYEAALRVHAGQWRQGGTMGSEALRPETREKINRGGGKRSEPSEAQLLAQARTLVELPAEVLPKPPFE
eukprot:2019095-Amphidinium_carterae.1